MKYIKIIPEEYDIGCSEDEIIKIKDSLNEQLPLAYIEFLKLVGVNFKSFHGFADFGWKNFKYAKERAQRMISISQKDIKLEDNDLVFLFGEVYNFVTFKLNNGENPPVYGFVTGQLENKLIKVCDSFSEFIELIKKQNDWHRKITIDPVLFKETEWGENEVERSNKYSENNDFENIPNKIFQQVESEYSGLEQKAAKLLISDFIAEKSNFSLTLIHDSLGPMLELSSGDYKRLLRRYITFINNPHFSPQLLIDESRRKNLKSVNEKPV